nr:transposase [Thiorhodococcus mannitoliphagus]
MTAKASKRPPKATRSVSTVASKPKGRKRHILVDTLSLILTVVVTAANVGDRAGLKQLLRG